MHGERGPAAEKPDLAHDPTFELQQAIVQIAGETQPSRG